MAEAICRIVWNLYIESMHLPIVYSPDYDAQFSADHRFPMAKYSRLIKRLETERLLTASNGYIPEAAPASWLELAHARNYVDCVINAAVPETIERQIGFPVNERVSRRARTATAGTILAARLALEYGLACNTAGGSHHARFEHGAGFCTFNDVAVAAKLLLAEGQIERAIVFDLDVHQGDGTAAIFQNDPSVVTVSIHAARNYPARKEVSDLDVALPDLVRDDAYLEIVCDTLEQTKRFGSPDIVFYNAGVDPHQDDRLGHLALTNAGLRQRDEAVLSHFKHLGVPLVGVLGGGYSHDIDALAERHAILFETATKIL